MDAPDVEIIRAAGLRIPLTRRSNFWTLRGVPVAVIERVRFAERERTTHLRIDTNSE
jgi:hypothetical protein